MDVTVYWILLIVSDSILMILWMIALQQLCITDNFADKQRLARVSFIIINIFFFLALNTLVYISAVYPDKILFLNVNAHTLYLLIQAFTVLIAFHMFRTLYMYIMDIIYNQISYQTPKWLVYLINILESIMMISVLILHALSLIFDNEDFIYYWYIIFGTIIFILPAVVFIILQQPLNILKSVQRNEHNHAKIRSAQLKIYGARVLIVTVCIFAALCNIFTLQKLINFYHLAFNFLLLDSINHSAVVIALGGALILWVYKTKYCCVIPDDSVCDVWCGSLCSLCTGDVDDFSDLISDSKHLPILLQESTTSINRYAGTVTTLTDNPLVIKSKSVKTETTLNGGISVIKSKSAKTV